MKRRTKVLIVDDEASIRNSLSAGLEDEGFDIFLAKDGSQALATMADEALDAVLLDIWMPGQDGLEVLSEAKKRFPNLQFVIMSGHGTIETAVKATKLGAYDFIEKPLSLEKVVIVLNNLLNLTQLKAENAQLLSRVKRDIRLIGESEPMQSLRQMISRVARRRVGF